MEFLLPDILGSELEQIPVEIGTGLSTDHDPEIIIMLRSLNERPRASDMSHEWPIPARE